VHHLLPMAKRSALAHVGLPVEGFLVSRWLVQVWLAAPPSSSLAHASSITLELT
jgi:hypothetical protein